MSFRGSLEGDDPVNPLGVRAIFVDSVSWRDDPSAVRGVIQTKKLMVIGEYPEGARVVEELAVEGAPFTTSDLCDMMRAAGVVDVGEIDLHGQRYAAVVGRC